MDVYNRYLMRHAQPGSELIGLSIVGVIQALQAGEFLAAMHMDKTTEGAFPLLTDVYTTDTLRTRQTGAIVAQTYNAFGLPKPNVIHEPQNGQGGHGTLISRIADDYSIGNDRAVLAVGHEPDLYDKFGDIRLYDTGKLNWDVGGGIALNASNDAVKKPDFVFLSVPLMFTNSHALALVMSLKKLGAKDPCEIVDHVLNSPDMVEKIFGHAADNYFVIPFKRNGR
jgi:phosphohistidine phosphatase SixA